MELETLGACGEVGRSAFLLKAGSEEKQVLLDYGMSMQDKNKYPGQVEPRNVGAVFLSHAHVDHSGALPNLYVSARPNCYMTKATRTVLKVLLDDMLRISGPDLMFEDIEVQHLFRSTQIVKQFNQAHPLPGFNDASFTFLDAGHIPGSAMVLVEMDGKRVLYTGDMNTRDTRLLWGARATGIPPLDALVIESTYATRAHPPRHEIEKEFVASVSDVLDNGGKVLVPAFGVARSQEILLVLQTHGLGDSRIVIDGMARDVSKLFLRNSEYLRAPYSLDRVNIVKKERSGEERRRALQSADVIIAPSGMMKGGTVRFYAENLLGGMNNAVFLVSYQVEGTPGRILLEQGTYEIEESDRFPRDQLLETKTRPIPVNARVAQFDFSSHCDGQDLLAFVNAVPFKNDGAGGRVFCIHGDAANCDHLASSINASGKGVEAIAPKVGETHAL